MHASPAKSSRSQSTDNAILIAIALATVIVHLLVGNSYGFQRDELATLDDARRLAWGYVAYPPVTPFFARLSLILFGTSITGFRVFAFIAQAIAVVLAGLMARELGGRRGAQLVSAAAAVPFCLAGGALMQYVSFDYLGWVLTAYFITRLLRSDDPRWWLAIGASVGFGMMAKYGMAFFVIGIVAGVVLTDARKYFRSKWLYLGIALSVVICLPNLIWQAKHDFISLDFLQHIHARDVRIGRTKNFLPEQLEMTQLAFPLFLAGLYFCLFSREGKRFRPLGWMYVVPLVVFVIAKGRSYYLAGAYPMLYAAGAVWGEQCIAAFRSGWQALTVRTLAWIALLVNIVLTAAFFLPLAPINSHWFQIASNLQGDYVEEIGWPELAQTIASVRDSLPPADRAHLGVFTGNYGEAGAIDLYGPAYGLPQAMGLTNSYWYLGYGDPPPQTFIMVGFSREWLSPKFSSCQLAAHTWNQYGILNEETKDHPDIFVCRGFQLDWPTFWKQYRRYG